jgi:predicted permease
MPPPLARLLLRLRALGHRRDEIEADLLELFEARAERHGERYARRRYYRDAFSLWKIAGIARIGKSAKSPVNTAGRAGGEKMPRQFWQSWQSWQLTVREIGQDLSYAVRLLRRSPGIVVVTILGLGLAIGVSTSVVSLLNAVALRPTGIVDPATAVRVMRAHPGGTGSSWKYADYLPLRESARSVTLEASIRGGAFFSTSPDDGAPDITGLAFVSGGYLAALTNSVTLGRLLGPEDDRAGAPSVVVLSHAFWSRSLGADPSIVGRPVWLNQAPFTVVGVGPRKFSGTTDDAPAMWVALAARHVVQGGPPLARHSSATVSIIGRVARTVSNAQAEAELSAVAVGALTDRARDPRSPGEFSVERSGDHDRAPAPETVLSGVRFEPIAGRSGKNATQFALILTVVVTTIGLVLLLACVNVANLLLASGIARQREIGVRLALGASRGRIVRQLLTESLSLGLAGGATGLLFTTVLVPVLVTVSRVPGSLDVAPDMGVYMFLGLISMVAGLGAGLAPARQAIRDDLTSPLKGVNERGEGAGRSSRLRSVLVGVQAAASIVLLVLAALLTRATVRATQVDVGFDAGRLLTVSAAFLRGTYDAAGAKAYWDLALDRVRALPAIEAATIAEQSPFGNGNRVTIFRRAGSRYTIYHNETQADYFSTLGLRVIRGRTYTADEVADDANVAVISEAIARDFFIGEDPIGQSLDRVTGGSRRIILGVVSNAITARLRELGSATIYQPLESSLTAKMLIRTAGPPEAMIASVRSALHPLDPRALLAISPVAERLQQQLDEPRALASVAAALAGLALALAVVGIYGVTAFVVGQRTQEIGVRIALGATARDVMRLILGDSLRPVLIGLGAGMLLALLCSRAFIGVLFGVGPADPLALAVAVLLLLSAAVAAVIVPTRRASAVEPAGVLRQL